MNIKADLSPEKYDNFEGGIVTLCIEDCGAACLAMIASYFGKYKKNNTYKKGHKRSHLKFVLFMTYSDNNFSSMIRVRREAKLMKKVIFITQFLFCLSAVFSKNIIVKDKIEYPIVIENQAESNHKIIRKEEKTVVL